ncbi:hypothetical protein OIU74_008129 [Salix koriyanagi]|uniref:Phosphoadenosine phosphosulphate reductase domain-containing protein n=1 Tax=Salix koriyanagi TaxID=2511006 RepID=A0A9Q0U5D6_9ROSI|nr:hypothetical protein OIU74_008129 [Salix koriyanagi]
MDIEYLHQECCRVLEVRRLGRALKGFCAWITGQRKDQSSGSRASVPALKIDPSVEGIGCGAISLLRWNPVASLGGQATWNFLQTMDVPLRYVSTDCETLTRPAFPWLHERGGRRWWEEGMVMERGLHEGNIESEDEQINVLYAPWRHFFQAMESSYAKLVDAEVKTGKFRVDGEHRAFANQKLQLRIFTTTVIFPGSKPIKYSSEKRDVGSQLAFESVSNLHIHPTPAFMVMSFTKIQCSSICGEIDEFPFETSDFCGEIDEFPLRVPL